MNKSVLTWVLVVIIILAGVGIYYFGSKYSNKSNNASQTVATNSVEIKNFAFKPADIKISKGTTVMWTNSDSATHAIKSDTGAFGSQDIISGQTYTHTFSDAGTFAYHCSIHPSMTGSVVVE